MFRGLRAQTVARLGPRRYEEYNQLYDVTAAAVKRALPTAKVGGPGTTGAGAPKAAAFLKQFLQHCADKKTPLDFITYHAKDAARWLR